MDWGLIPEIFYDTVGRIVPGLFIIIVSIFLFLGPSEAVEYLLLQLADASIWTFLFLALFSYVIAIIMKQPWEVAILIRGWQEERKANAKKSETGIGEGVSTEETSESSSDTSGFLQDDLILQYLRLKHPSEAYRLLKLQAEKNFCEVLITGLSILCLFSILTMLVSNKRLIEDVYLLVGMVICLLSCVTWRKSLEEVYIRELGVVRSFIASLQTMKWPGITAEDLSGPKTQT
jgi:hypothetical protein